MCSGWLEDCIGGDCAAILFVKTGLRKGSLALSFLRYERENDKSKGTIQLLLVIIIENVRLSGHVIGQTYQIELYNTHVRLCV